MLLQDSIALFLKAPFEPKSAFKSIIEHEIQPKESFKLFIIITLVFSLVHMASVLFVFETSTTIKLLNILGFTVGFVSKVLFTAYIFALVAHRVQLKMFDFKTALMVVLIAQFPYLINVSAALTSVLLIPYLQGIASLWSSVIMYFGIRAKFKYRAVGAIGTIMFSQIFIFLIQYTIIGIRL